MSETEARPRNRDHDAQYKYTVQEKVRLVLEGSRGEHPIAEICQREGLSTNLYYQWVRAFLSGGRKGLAEHSATDAAPARRAHLRSESDNEQVNELVGKLDHLLALYAQSHSSEARQHQRLSSLEGDQKKTEDASPDYRVQIDKLEQDVERHLGENYNTALHAEWLELELESIVTRSESRIAQSFGGVIQRCRAGYRLLKRLFATLFRFGPAVTMLRAKSYLGSYGLFRKTLSVLSIFKINLIQGSANDPEKALVRSGEYAERYRWAMYVSEFYDGGLEKVVTDLAVELSARGVPCLILVKGRAGRAGNEARKLGIEVAEFDGNATALLQFIQDMGIERVITHHCYDFLDKISALGVMVDEVLHNAYHWQKENRSLADLRDRCIDSCVSVSEFVNAYAIQELQIRPDKLRIIHNGLAREGLMRPPVELMKRRRMSTVSSPVLIMLANAHPQKNHIAVLHAMRDIKVSFPDVKLYMCGVIDESTRLGKSIRATAEKFQLSPTVEFTGPLDREALSRLLNASHVALLPTLVEGYSIASLEYCYFGLPMVLSSTGASLMLMESFGSVELAEDVALPVSQLNVDNIERQSLHPDRKSVIGIVSAVNRVLGNYQDYLNNAEIAANSWKQYSLESTVDRYLLLGD